MDDVMNGSYTSPNSTLMNQTCNGTCNSTEASYQGNQAFIGSQTWGWWLLQIGTPIILIIGVPGNILSIMVMKSRRYKSKSYAHYLSALAVFDSLVLIGKYLQRVNKLIEATGSDGIFASYGNVACKVHNFAEHVCFLMSSWLVLCMTLERFIAVVFPFKKEKFCRPRNAVTIIMIVFAVMSYSQIFRLIIIEKEDGMCSAAEEYLRIYIAMHIYMYQLVLQFMLPATVVLICNLTILYKINKLRNRLTKHGSRSHYSQHLRKRNKTTCMLLIVSFTYVVTLLPLVILSLIMHISSRVSPPLAMYLMYNLNDFRQTMELLSEVNYGVNFYIYVMSGAQFRYQLRHICSHRYSFMSSGQTEKVIQFRKSASK